MSMNPHKDQSILIHLVRLAYIRGVTLTFEPDHSEISLAMLSSRGATKELKYPSFIQVLNAVSTWDPWPDERTPLE